MAPIAKLEKINHGYHIYPQPTANPSVIVPKQPIPDDNLETQPKKISKKYLIIALSIILIILAGGGVYFLWGRQRLSPTPTPPLASPTHSPQLKITPTPTNIIESDKEKEKEVALKAVSGMQQALECQYSLDLKYPDSLGQVNQKCQPNPSDFKVPAIVANLDDLNYRSTNNGQGYYFEMTVVMGEGYIVTEKGMEYLTISQDVQIEAFAKERDSARKFDAHELSNNIERFYASQTCYPWSWDSTIKKCQSSLIKITTARHLDLDGAEKPLLDTGELKIPFKTRLETSSNPSYQKLWIIEDNSEGVDKAGIVFVCFEPESKTARMGGLGSLTGNLNQPSLYQLSKSIKSCSSGEYQGGQNPNQDCWLCVPQ